MKNLNFNWLSGLFTILFVYPLLPTHAQCIPSLGTASGFAIYTAGGAVANTAISNVNGNIGTNLGAITGFTTAVVTGSFHNGTTLTQTVAQDLSTAYNAFQNLIPTVTNHNMVFGNGETITAGIYSIAGAVSVAGSLTLDGQNNPNAKFIFQVGGALNSSASANLVLTNGVTPNNIYWIVLDACGLGANTTFYGTVMSGAAIAAGANCQIQGKLLSVGGAIAINSTNLVNNGSSMFYADADFDGYGNAAISSCTFITGYVNNDKDCNDFDATRNPTAVEIWGNYIDENCDGIIFRPQEQCLPSVGVASEFTLFTGSGAITHSATVSNITGNIGTNLGTISGFELSNITGLFINANSTTQTAKEDLILAYTSFQNLTPTVTDHAPAFGSETLTAGIYSIGGAGSLGGILTLDGQNNPNGKFVFKFGGAFTTGAASSIVLINGVLPQNIYWIANGAAGLAANVTFKGTIINNAALSVGAGCELNGKLLTTTGAITVLGSNLVNNGGGYIYYLDNDGDGYGGLSNSVLSNGCFLAGYTLVGNDCNDANSYIHPNATEIYGNGIDDNCNGITDTDISTCGNTTTWDGNTWSNGIPTYGNSVIFSGNYTSTTDIFACSILVTNNATVTFNNNVFVYNEITINTGSFFTMNNNNNLLQINPLAINIGNILIHRNTSTLVRLDHTLWSAPVIGQNIYNFSPQTLTHRFYTYDTATNTYLSSTLSNTSEFVPAKGYAIRAANNQSATIPAEWDGSFAGVPNNGTYPFNLTHTTVNKFNLLGNPYPSNINATTFVTDNAATIEGTLYFYAHTLTMDANGIFPTGTNYASWNATGGTAATSVAINSPNYHTPAVIPNGSIQIGQGFFVKAKNNGTVNFTNAQRTNNQDHQFFKTTTENHHIWLNATTNDGKDLNQILIGYLEGATIGIDTNYDGKSYGNVGNHLYSICNNEKLVIQGRAIPFNTTDEVPLGWYCDTAGTFKLKLSNWDGIFQGNQDVFIKDNITGTTTNIKTTPYTFTSTPGTFNNRFSIVYEQNLGETTHHLNSNSIIVYKKDQLFHITSQNKVIKDILIYDVTGRLLYQNKDILAKTITLNEISQTNQVLLFKINFIDNQNYNLKVLN